MPAKLLANWVTGEYMRLAKGEGSGGSVDPAELAALVKLVADGAISGTNAKEVFAEHFASGAGVAAIVEARGFRQISDAGALGAAIERCSRPTPPPSRTIGRARPPRSASSSARS